MRRILIERARQRATLKRGGNHQRLDMEAIEPAVLPLHCDDILGLDEALKKLEQQHPRKAELVKLRFFAGLTTAQAAQTLGVSVSTVRGETEHAMKAWDDLLEYGKGAMVFWPIAELFRAGEIERIKSLKAREPERQIAQAYVLALSSSQADCDAPSASLTG